MDDVPTNGPRGAAVVRLAVAITLIAIVACGPSKRQSTPTIHDLGGHTMGSTWSVRVVGPPDLDEVALRAQIDAQLDELDRQLSGYRDAAELSRLNHAAVGEWRAAAPYLAAVIRFGQSLHDESGGAFDLTVRPLVNVWGFGAPGRRTTLPSADEIESARARLGSDRIEFSDDAARVRRTADVAADVDAIAPGYATDIVAAWLASQGLPNHLVEIGGELHASGRRPDGQQWQIGIERPTLQRSGMQRVIRVTDCGVSTSGDYRAVEELDGKRYSHTIDPATGRPVDHALASVTVIAPSGLEADGYATTMMVLGPERGLAWADARGVAAYMIVRNDAGGLVERFNAAFEPLLVAD